MCMCGCVQHVNYMFGASDNFTILDTDKWSHIAEDVRDRAHELLHRHIPASCVIH